jgi:isopentenyldiphosphate isomerase
VTTDPTELLEVFDAAACPTGIAKTRAAVHRDGDWHLAFFCWIVRRNGERLELVLQKRAAHKDVWPGRFDASAAGHVRFGESAAEASREIEEELGLHVSYAELTPVMRHREEHVHDNGLVDREIHDVHLWRCDVPLDEYRPGPEVSGVVSVPLDDVVALAKRERASLPATLVTFDTQTPIVLRPDDLVPYAAAYWDALARAARDHSGRASMARR